MSPTLDELKWRSGASGDLAFRYASLQWPHGWPLVFSSYRGMVFHNLDRGFVQAKGEYNVRSPFAWRGTGEQWDHLDKFEAQMIVDHLMRPPWDHTRRRISKWLSSMVRRQS
jgi:hypothetical protein